MKIRVGAKNKTPAKAKRNLQEIIAGFFIPKGDPSWSQKEVIPRCQRDNFYVVYNFYVDPSWSQKELTLRCQQENSAPTEFKIQMWVLNFGRGVDVELYPVTRWWSVQLLDCRQWDSLISLYVLVVFFNKMPVLSLYG